MGGEDSKGASGRDRLLGGRVGKAEALGRRHRRHVRAHDAAILSELTENARVSQVDLAALTAFEAGVLECPSVVRCFPMSGSDDYVVTVLARDIEDFERIHRTELSRLPRVAWLESSFALREVVTRAVPPSVFGKTARSVQRRRRAEA